MFLWFLACGIDKALLPTPLLTPQLFCIDSLCTKGRTVQPWNYTSDLPLPE